MRFIVLCAVVVCCVGALRAQDSTIDAVSIGADRSGREALCEELRRMSTRPKDVPIVPAGYELLCDGDGAAKLALRGQRAPTSIEAFICEFVAKPSSLVFYQMRPIALKSRSTVTSPEDLSEKLQPLGVRNLGRLFASFGFLDLEIRRGSATEPLRKIGIHELPLLCAG